MEIQTEQIASRKAFEDLLITNMSVLKEMARRFAREQDEVEDLVQDTLLKALRFHEKFSMDTNIRGWLFTIMRNTFINSANRISRGRNLELILEVGMKSVHSVNTVFVKLITDEVEQAICRLDPVLRQPIRLYNAVIQVP